MGSRALSAHIHSRDAIRIGTLPVLDRKPVRTGRVGDKRNPSWARNFQLNTKAFLLDSRLEFEFKSDWQSSIVPLLLASTTRDSPSKELKLNGQTAQVNYDHYDLDYGPFSKKKILHFFPHSFLGWFIGHKTNQFQLVGKVVTEWNMCYIYKADYLITNWILVAGPLSSNSRPSEKGPPS